MEDPNEEEGEIADCSTCEVVGVGDEDEKSSGLSWVLNAGLRLGKKAVITGIVVTSVPVILPPLVVISALGFAVSVPYGVVLASYVGTEKLMNKLLPPRAFQSPEIGYYTVSPQEEEFEAKGRIRFELVEIEESGGLRDDAKVCTDVNDHDELNAGAVSREEREERLLLPPREEEKQYLNMEEYIGGGADATKTESRDNEDKALVEGQADKSPVENEGEKNVTFMERRDKILEEENVEGKKNDDRVEDMEGRNGQLDSKEKRRRGKRKSSKALKFLGRKKEEGHDGLKHGELSQKDEEGRVASVEETSSVDSRENQRIGEVLVNDDVGNMAGTLENEEQKLLGLKAMPEADVEETGRDEIGGLSREKRWQVGEQERVTPSVVVLTNKDVGNTARSLEKESTGLKENVAGQEKSIDERHSVSIESEEAAEQENAAPYSGVSTNRDVGNMESSVEKEQKPVGLEEMPKGQSAFEVYHEVTVETAEDAFADDEVMSRTGANGGKYSLEMVTLTSAPESKRVEEIPGPKGGEDAPSVDGNLNSNEASLGDEEIWKKIDAIRGIVGHKAPRKPSYFEELKVLYIFTGVEPPSSLSRDSTDVSEFNGRLGFLMSVIGLK